MFGLEAQKQSKKPQPFLFDLEKDMMSGKNREVKGKVEQRIQAIKATLRSGDSKEEFDHLGVLLHGYTALQKVISRIPSKG